MIVGGKTLYLFNLYDPDNPIELAFQSRYGSIVSYKWFGDGYILIGKTSPEPGVKLRMGYVKIGKLLRAVCGQDRQSVGLLPV